jgi:hypothetical protein
MRKKKSLFERKETGYHKFAVRELASWVNGIIEQPFYIGKSVLFVPDVTCYEDGILKSLYEVTYSNPITGKKLGLIQEWCYRNATELSVFEVSADYILSQLKKPERIETMECYDVNVI